jgi:hypothetical protein
MRAGEPLPPARVLVLLVVGIVALSVATAVYFVITAV